MWTVLIRLLQHGGRKLLLVGVVLGVSLAGGALYLAAEGERARLERDAELYRERLAYVETELARWEAEARRQAELGRLAAERARLTEERIRRLRGVIQRLLSAVGVATAEQAELAALESQRAELESQAERYRASEAAARRTTEAKAIERTVRQAELERAEEQRTARDVLRERTREYVTAAWHRYGRWIALTIVLIIIGPTLSKLVLYFGWAPWASRAPPVRLLPEPETAADVLRPMARGGWVSHTVTLGPDEEVLVKERFLQSSDVGCRKRTRFVLDWRHPFTSAASGLIELVHLIPEAGPGRGAVRVTFSTVDETTTELLEVDVPEGVEVVIRPRFVAGLIRAQHGPGGRWTARWRLGTLHAWITLQFRYFSVRGPIRLLLWGARGVRFETVEPGRARRTNADSTIGFSPTLAYRSQRAETFWAYYRGMNPLFDDCFEGHGVFLCQEVSLAPRGGVRRFWAGVWEGILKVLGL